MTVRSLILNERRKLADFFDFLKKLHIFDSKSTFYTILSSFLTLQKIVELQWNVYPSKFEVLIENHEKINQFNVPT
jgi:hypothetical protein